MTAIELWVASIPPPLFPVAVLFTIMLREMLMVQFFVFIAPPFTPALLLKKVLLLTLMHDNTAFKVPFLEAKLSMKLLLLMYM